MSINLDPDNQCRLLSILEEKLHDCANLDRLENEIKLNLLKNEIQFDGDRVASQAKSSIRAAAQTIHNMMLEILHDRKVYGLKVTGRANNASVSLEIKDTPTRRRQIKSLGDAAASGSDWKWAKAWIACSDKLQGELEYLAIGHDIGHQKKAQLSSNRAYLPGVVPSPERILPLIDRLGTDEGGRPKSDILRFGIALILDNRQYLAQDKTWGINPGKFELGIDLVFEVFELYGAVELIENQIAPNRWLFEEARKFRNSPPDRNIPEKPALNAFDNLDDDSVISHQSERPWTGPRKKPRKKVASRKRKLIKGAGFR